MKITVFPTIIWIHLPSCASALPKKEPGENTLIQSQMNVRMSLFSCHEENEQDERTRSKVLGM